MAIAPLFLKYQTQSGNCYLYDSGTNELIRVAGVIYDILDDFHVLDADELLEKYQSLGETNVRQALVELDKLQDKGMLCDHEPQLPFMPERVLCQGKEESLANFLRSQRRMLTLELTQDCNLRCEYCCYGEYYPSFRKHNDTTMSLDTAKNAIKDFVDHKPKEIDLAFFGGEPLLAFPLLKEIVLFAEEIADKCGLKSRFGLTTNGTLLTDDIIHFLVEHSFIVMISLDGDRESHDRYRMFRNKDCPLQKRGTYDTIMKNMQRFVELYPTYLARGIALTVTATADFDKTNDLLGTLQHSFPLRTMSAIRDITYASQENGAVRNERQAVACEDGCCRAGAMASKLRDGQAQVLHGQAGASCKQEGTPEAADFCNWTKEREDILRAGYDHFVKELCQTCDGDRIKSRFAFYCSLFEERSKGLHHRRLFARRPKSTFRNVCCVGAIKTFCSSHGVLYPCERTETGSFFELGDAINGVDVRRALRVMQVCRLLGDCENCIGKWLCTLCPAAVVEQGSTGKPDALPFRKSCERTLANLKRMFETYTTIMEVDPKLGSAIIGEPEPDDWGLMFVPPASGQPCESEVGVEELENPV